MAGNYVSILEDNLAPFAEAAKARLDTAIKASVADKSQQILKMSQTLCPVSVAGHEGSTGLDSRNHPPGTLRDSLHAVISKGGHFASVRADITKAYYAFMVHFGTVKQPANPFLYQAKERVMGGDGFSKEIKDNFDKGQ